MVEPIVLDKNTGEILLGYPGSEQGDEGELWCCIGVHEICRGWVDIKPISTTHQALVCRSCGMRILVPASVKTFGDLRSFFNKKNSGVSPGP